MENITDFEKEKIDDFFKIFRKYINPNNNELINRVVDYVIDELIKIYLNYKDECPTVSVEDDEYLYYVIRPSNGVYSLLDYLINTVIQNLDSIELINNKNTSSYNMLAKRIYINVNQKELLHKSVFDCIRKKIDRNEYLDLYFKNLLYHEIGHMLHYKIRKIDDNTVYVPIYYLSQSEFPKMKKFMSKGKREKEALRREKIVKERARKKIIERVSLYSELSDKYDVLNPNILENVDVAVEDVVKRHEEVFFPPLLYMNPVDEAFTECDAQVYSGMFENLIFENEEKDQLECFYIPIDDNHTLMCYSPSCYSFSASIASTIKGIVSKNAYFRTMFLGKDDLFIELLGEYEFKSTDLFSRRLIAANNNKFESVEPLLDYIVKCYRNNNKSLKPLDIYFPLVFINGEWLYYTEALNVGTPAVLAKHSSERNKKDDF